MCAYFKLKWIDVQANYVCMVYFRNIFLFSSTSYLIFHSTLTRAIAHHANCIKHGLAFANFSFLRKMLLAAVIIIFLLFLYFDLCAFFFPSLILITHSACAVCAGEHFSFSLARNSVFIDFCLVEFNQYHVYLNM